MTAADQPTTEPSAEAVYQAWHGTDEPWGGCADREAVERVLALLAPAPQHAADTEGLREALANADRHRHEYGAQWIVALADEVLRLRALASAADTETEVQVPCVLTDRNDMEVYAEAFNTGFELAVVQGLADDPVKADEWLAEHDERVRETVLRGARAQSESLQRIINTLAELGGGEAMHEAKLEALRIEQHRECDCVPNLGPPHCHACGDAAGEPVPWSERRCEG